MKFNRARQVVAIISLLAFLLTGQAGAFGLVLCIGADGHAAVEQDHRGGCARAEGCPTPAPTETHCEGSAEHGTPCTDVEQSCSTATRRYEPTLNVAVVAAAPLSPIPPFSLPCAALAASMRSGADSTSPPLTLQVLRTTILRC